MGELVNSNYIPPKRITEDQYDSLMRELWEMKQRLASAEKTVYTSVQVDELFDRQQHIEEKLLRVNITINSLVQSCTLLMQLCNKKMALREPYIDQGKV